jgi:hypothetical protein
LFASRLLPDRPKSSRDLHACTDGTHVRIHRRRAYSTARVHCADVTSTRAYVHALLCMNYKYRATTCTHCSHGGMEQQQHLSAISLLSITFPSLRGSETRCCCAAAGRGGPLRHASLLIGAYRRPAQGLPDRFRSAGSQPVQIQYLNLN